MTDVDLIKLKFSNVLKGFVGQELNKQTIAKINYTCKSILEEHKDILHKGSINIKSEWAMLTTGGKLIHFMRGTRRKLQRQLHVDLTIISKNKLI